MAFSIINAGHPNRIDSNMSLCYYYIDAAVAQVVAHLIGSEEVTGPSPVSSFALTLEFSRAIFLCISVDSSNAYLTAYYSFYFTVCIYK